MGPPPSQKNSSALPEQSGKHPIDVPASQSSTPKTFPSPQTVEHLEGSCSHLNPDSILHLSEHPSEFKLFASSHSSFAVKVPSPHFEQEEGRPSQVKNSSILPSELHPSPEFEFKSSHASLPTSIPSPVKGMQVSA